MSTTNVTIRMDENLKKQFDHLCNEIGLSMGSAINIFAKAVVRERRIPFELAAPTPNRDTIEAMLEAERIAKEPRTKKYSSVEALFTELDSDEV